MKANIVAAAILALGLIVGGFCVGGRYEFILVQGNELARLDRFTGEVSMCVSGAECGFKLDRPHQSSN